jgi:hypothetical protein
MSFSAEHSQSSDRRPQFWWPLVLCLVGLDYFSTLAYQPSIAYQAAGALAPFATLAIVLVTLLCAVPVYAHVAMRSPHGHGSMGMLERMIPGWRGKFIILALLGFAATDFVFTRTLSVADAAVHLVENPDPTWQSFLDKASVAGQALRPFSAHPLWSRFVNYWDRQMVVTVLLLVVFFAFWAIFRKGFTRRIVWLAVLVTCWYLTQSAIIIVAGIRYLLQEGTLLDAWQSRLLNGTDAASTALHVLRLGFQSTALLPKMALAVSGFELSMVVMPLIWAKPGPHHFSQATRIRSTRKLLLAAAGLMSLLLLGSAVLVTTVIPAPELAPQGHAANRALAYLAHGGRMNNGQGAQAICPFFGTGFGTLYDAATILILCLAGASVTIGLRDLVPPYLHRLGMEMRWAHAVGAILYVFNAVKLVVTLVFHADVNAQRGAYATSVLVLMTSASIACVIDCWPRPSQEGRRLPRIMLLAAGIFSTIAIGVMVRNPAGLIIALASIVCILALSIVSRLVRTSELRFGGFRFADPQSRFLWDSLKVLEFPVLVPHRPGGRLLEAKEAEIRMRHRLTADVPVVFVEAHLGDPSDFHHQPLIAVERNGERFVIRADACASIPHALAAIALELSQVGKPPEIHFGWSDESPLRANTSFVLFGEGNVPWMVRELIRHAEPTADRRPQVIIG